jgi:hypothetical protein
MTLPIEIMLRGNAQVFTESLSHPVDAARWTEADVATVMKGMLLAINRVQNPGKSDLPDVGLRGLNWIVHPGANGVVIAIEIHSGSAVAGPVALAADALEALIGRAVAAANRPEIVH